MTLSKGNIWTQRTPRERAEKQIRNLILIGWGIGAVLGVILAAFGAAIFLVLVPVIMSRLIFRYMDTILDKNPELAIAVESLPDDTEASR